LQHGTEIKIISTARDVPRVIKCLPSMNEAPSSIPSTANKTNNNVAKQTGQRLPLLGSLPCLTTQVELSLLTFGFTVYIWHSRAPIGLNSMFYFNVSWLPLDCELLTSTNHGWLSIVPTPPPFTSPGEPLLVAPRLGIGPYCSLPKLYVKQLPPYPTTVKASQRPD
jgi:hypothetical protein